MELFICDDDGKCHLADTQTGVQGQAFMKHWYVIQTKPRREKQVGSALERQGIQVYLPLVQVRRVNPRASPVTPFFPGYLFARADLACVGVSAPNWVPGSVRLLGFDGEPAAVPDVIVEHIRERISDMERKYDLGSGPFQPGDQLRIVGGPFRDLDAVFDRALSPSGRVQVLVKFLGRIVRGEVDLSMLEKIDRPKAPHSLPAA